MRIAELIRKMTVEEKVMQLCSLMDRELLQDGKLSRARMKKHLSKGIGFVASLTRDFEPGDGADVLNEAQRFLVENTRLGIPAVMHEECLHGNMSRGATVFPQSIGMAASWDPEFYTRVARAIAEEARARGFTLALSPTINIARDPRCGRTEETYGEDPLLTTRMALAFVKTMQANGVGCTPKHFVANFVGDGGRDSHDVHFSERELREVYFPAFEAVVRKAKATAIMPAYNTLNGEPCSSHEWLLIDVLRKEWGFEGVTGSDYWAIDNMARSQFVARDAAECARKALLGGMDVEWPNSSTYPELIQQVKSGAVPVKALDRSVERVLRLKERMGVLRNPYADRLRAIRLANCAKHRTLAREAAARSMVLLKNQGLLPLSRRIRKLAVIGPNAAAIRTGGYSSTGAKVVTPLKGLQALLGKDRVVYARGCTNTGGTRAGIAAAATIAKRADAAVVFMGNWSGGSWVRKPHSEGEGRDRSNLALPGMQEQLVAAVSAANRNTAVVLIGGSAVTMERWLGEVRAVLEAWYPGGEGGTAIAETLFGNRNPGGKLPLTFPIREGQLPCYYNLKPTGRHFDYLDLRGAQAQFPFGHGLSYTSFEYRSLRITKTAGGVKVACTVKNTGRRAGDEVVQVYVHDKYSSLTRPLKELKGFERISLDPSESVRITIALTRKDLSFLNDRMKWAFEPGEFEIMVGSSSTDIRLQRTATL